MTSSMLSGSPDHVACTVTGPVRLKLYRFILWCLLLVEYVGVVGVVDVVEVRVASAGDFTAQGAPRISKVPGEDPLIEEPKDIADSLVVIVVEDCAIVNQMG